MHPVAAPGQGAAPGGAPPKRLSPAAWTLLVLACVLLLTVVTVVLVTMVGADGDGGSPGGNGDTPPLGDTWPTTGGRSPGVPGGGG